MLLALVLVTLAGGTWGWQSLQGVQSVCDDAITKTRRHVAQRKQAEEQALVEEKRLQRKQERIRNDAAARDERIRWTSVINAATSQLKDEQSDSKQTAFRLAKFRTAQSRLPDFKPSSQVTKKDASFWSFQRLSRIQPPRVDDPSWCRNGIDQFILARLTSAGLAPNPSATQQVLGRRLSFDLIGLPPTPEEITAFVTTNEPAAYEQLVDRLLRNPAFGERWGRTWLDLACYADSNGYEEDELRPHAYLYRDFVIWAMNNDLPFDVFTRWPIAGDELEADNPLAVAATGFFTAAPLNTFIPQESERFDELDDMVSTMGRAMLGLTIGCARCHDHMYDPIPTSEYYGLVAIFSETSRNQSYLVPDGGKAYRQWFDPVDTRRREIKRMMKARIKEDNISDLDYFTAEEKNLLRQPIDPNNLEQERLISLCERCLMITDEQLDDDLKPLPKDKQRYEQLQVELKELEAQLPPRPPVGLMLTGHDISRTHVLDGGDLKRNRDEVGPGFLAAVTAGRPAWNDDTWKTWAATDGASETLCDSPRLADSGRLQENLPESASRGLSQFRPQIRSQN